MLHLVFSTGDLTDRTTELNTILSGAGHIYLGPGLYMISGSLNVQSNTHLQLHPQAIIRRSLSTPTQTQMVRLSDRSNVIIEGGVLDGNKQSNTPGIGGQCQGLALAGGQDILIRDMEIKNWPEDATDPDTGDQHGSYGDGIYIGSGGSQQRVHPSPD